MRLAVRRVYGSLLNSDDDAGAIDPVAWQDADFRLRRRRFNAKTAAGASTNCIDPGTRTISPAAPLTRHASVRVVPVVAMSCPAPPSSDKKIAPGDDVVAAFCPMEPDGRKTNLGRR
jgi:hypothetical protein